jgi:hypothetical protein
MIRAGALCAVAFACAAYAPWQALAQVKAHKPLVRPFPFVALVNPDFESAKPGMFGNPEGWFSIQHAGDLSYTFRLDGAVRHGGARSVRIDNVGPEPFGSIYQHVPASQYVGRRLRFSAWLRTADARGSVTGGGGVLLIQAMQGGAPLAWNHMRDTPVRGTQEWARYSLELDVPAAADQVEVGAMLHGPGTLWLDDAELEVVEAAR